MASGPDGAEARASWARSAESLVGTVVGGKFRIESILGRGGMGTIYRAVQEPLGRKVALKVLHSNLGDADADPEFAKRFLLEAATLSKLSHPNIVVVHDYGRLEGGEAACFMAMELLEGQTINQVLDATGPFTPARALKITRDIARALRAAHAIGVIHRDLKPSNAMLCVSPEGETLKVLDFGLVKVLRDDSEELTAEGRFLGSPRYMSPEQIQRFPMDGRSDLYSLGIILYRMLSNEVPFAGDHAVQTLMAHLTEPVPSIQQRTGIAVPPPVEALMLKLLAKKPDDRPASASELIAEIDAIWPQLSEEDLPRSREMSLSGAYATGLVSGEHTPPSLSGQLIVPPSSSSLPFGPGPVSGAVPPLASSEMSLAGPAPAQSKLPLILAVSAVSLLGILGGAGIVALLRSDPLPEPAPSVSTTEPSTATPTTATQPGEAPSAGPQHFTLRLTSEPVGAVVERDGVVLGVTPLAAQLDSREVESRPARFTVRMEGYRTFSFEQGPGSGEVPRAVTLARVEPPPVLRRGSNGRRGGTTSSTATPTTSPEPGSGSGAGADLSIKTSR